MSEATQIAALEAEIVALRLIVERIVIDALETNSRHQAELAAIQSPAAQN